MIIEIALSVDSQTECRHSLLSEFGYVRPAAALLNTVGFDRPEEIGPPCDSLDNLGVGLDAKPARRKTARVSLDRGDVFFSRPVLRRVSLGASQPVLLVHEEHDTDRSLRG